MINKDSLFFSNTCEDLALTTDTFSTVTTFKFKSTNAQETLLPLVILVKDSNPLCMVSKAGVNLGPYDMNSLFENKMKLPIAVNLNGLFQFTDYSFLMTVANSGDMLIGILQINQIAQSMIIQQDIRMTQTQRVSAFPLLNDVLFILYSEASNDNLEVKFCDGSTLLSNTPIPLSFPMDNRRPYFLLLEMNYENIVFCWIK